jgi:putative ABC transport system permease protein
MVVWLVIGCAGALAFIVLFNLSNINITERVREIATIKVLGFYQRETGAYVFRENLVLTFMGIVVGIPLGVLLNGFIISQIKVDMFIIKETLFPISYVLTVVLVFLPETSSAVISNFTHS